ncbi:MAG: transposase [Chloroflexota bacterium]
MTSLSGSDTDVTVRAIDSLAERNARPGELFVDTLYGSGKNAFEAERRGTELVSPVAGLMPGESHQAESQELLRFIPIDFQIDAKREQPTVCPAGHQSTKEYERKGAPERADIHFARSTCKTFPLRARCSVKLDPQTGDYVLKADLVKVNIKQRQLAEAGEEWHKRYAMRAGIEGTNLELKRRHGLGQLRVRGGRRVGLPSTSRHWHAISNA